MRLLRYKIHLVNCSLLGSKIEIKFLYFRMPCFTYSASAFELRGREVDILVDLYDDTEEREYIPRVQSMIRQINWSDWFSRMETSMHFNTSAEWFLMNCSHDRVGMPMRIELEDHYPRTFCHRESCFREGSASCSIGYNSDPTLRCLLYCPTSS